MIRDVGVRLHSPSVGLSPESSASSTSDNSILGLRPDVVLLAIPALPVILRLASGASLLVSASVWLHHDQSL